MIDVLGFLGVCVCLYSLKVENNAKKKKEDDYDEYCDLSDRMSCSRVLTSKYSKMFGLIFGLSPDHPLNQSNAHAGLFYYTMLMLYPVINFPYKAYLLLTMSTVSIIFSVVLLYCMIVKLNDLCLVCMLIHLINLGVLYVSYSQCC